MNATETIILECNNAESVKAKSGGLPSFTKLDKSTWSNNFQSIEINRGDTLTMEYAIINQLGGGQSEAIEFSPPTEEVMNREYNSNSVIFEVEFYINHNGINSVGLPFGNNDALANPMETYTSSQTDLNSAKYPTGWIPTNSNNFLLRSSNRLLMTDCRKYTLLHPNFMTEFGVATTYLRTDKRYIQYQQSKNFISSDSLANELTIKFHETSTNPPRLNASELDTADTLDDVLNDEALGIIKPCSFITSNASTPSVKPTRLGASYTLNKNTYITRGCNLTTPLINDDGTFEFIESNIYSQMAVLNPYKWIGGGHFNNALTYDMLGDTDITATAQVYPRILARYLQDVTPTTFLPFTGLVGAKTRTLLGENMAIFTTINSSTTNLDKIKIYFDNICKYYGSELNETEARKDKENWSCILDIGRTSQAGQSGITDFGTAINGTDLSFTSGTFTCPTISKTANNEEINPLIVDGDLNYGGGIGVKPFFKDLFNDFASYVGSIDSADYSFSVDEDFIEFTTDILSQEVAVYNHARDNNIGAYPYIYTDNTGASRFCLCFLVSKTALNHLPKPLTCGNYVGFSPSFYDNSAVMLLNKDKSTPTIGGSAISNVNPYLNIGATDIQITYSSALSSFGFSNLHTERKKGWKDDTGSTSGLGAPIVAINEILNLAGNINATNGRSTNRLNRDGNVAPKFQFQSDAADINVGYSDSIAGIFIKEVYFGKNTFNPNQYSSRQLLADPTILDKIAVKASEDNWYGSLLWKMGGEYIDFYSQFTNLSRGLRFNNNFWRNQSTTRSVAPFTTNSDIDCSTAPFINVGGLGQSGTYQGLGNYGLGYDNNAPVLIGSIGSAVMYFTGEIKKSETGFYRIYTDFCSPTYLDGDGGNLNVIGLALKSYNSNDFFYSYSPSYTMTADRNYILSNITTSIRNSDGNLANVGDRCVIVYKITKAKTILQPPQATQDNGDNELEDVVEELKELNTTSSMNNMLLRGSRGSSGGGGGGGGSRNKDRLRQEDITTINRENVDSSSLAEGGRILNVGLERVLTAGDYSSLKSDLTRQLVLNVLDRIPTSDLVDQEGNFDYTRYVSIASEVLPQLYGRFSRIINENIGRMEELQQSGASQGVRRRTLAGISQTLARAVDGVEINPNGDSFLSIAQVSRRTEGVGGQLDATLSPEGLEVIMNTLAGGASAGELRQELNSMVESSNITIDYQGEPITGTGGATFQEGVSRQEELGGVRGRYLPANINVMIRQARENSDGTQRGAIEWINQQLRNTAEGAEPRTRRERETQESYLRLLGDSRYFLITGNRQPRPLTRDSVSTLFSRRIRSRAGEDRRLAEDQSAGTLEYVGVEGTSAETEYAPVASAGQLQEVVNTQPDPPAPRTEDRTEKEKRPDT